MNLKKNACLQMNTLLYAKLLVSISVNAIKIKWATNQIRSKVGSMIEFAAFLYFI